MKRRWYALGSILLFLSCMLCTVLFLQERPKGTAEERVQAVLEERDNKPEPNDTTEPPSYESPIDFPALWEMNPDIYAWLQIPDTEISYPILQREGDDSYYLRRDSTGKKDPKGCIFTESEFNRQDFTDPVTVIYGHYMSNGTMFGNLQSTYSSEEGIEKKNEIVIYLPDRELHYQVFAGVPYSSRHILYYNDFSDPEVYQDFLDKTLAVRSMNANVDECVEVNPRDQLLILSTCLRGDNQQRYLVLARRTAEMPAAGE